MTDGLSSLYQELLSGSYDCVDRIVLNAYFGMGHSPGGFRVWWRALTGSDETLDNAHLMRLAGRFSRNLIFVVGGRMEQVFQALIDRSRAPLDLKTINYSLRVFGQVGSTGKMLESRNFGPNA